MTLEFFWLAALTGLVSVFTPCVFPMLPITVAYFARPTNHTRKPSVLLFALGIIGSFTVVGGLVAVLVGASGLSRIAADPWVNVALGVVLVLFAASLLGAFRWLPPVGWRIVNSVDKLARRQSGHAAGAALMGVAFTLASFTCTAPFAGPLLVAAARGEWYGAMLGMLVFSIVFASPFVVLAMLPAGARRLPKAGDWMSPLLVVAAAIELAAAVKFFSNADLVWGTAYISRELMIGVWLALAACGAVYLVLYAVRGGGGLMSRRGLPALAAIAVSVWLSAGIRGRPLGELEAFLPPSDLRQGVVTSGSADGGETAEQLQWIVNNLPQSLARARASGKHVLIDFTGYTCTNCRWMEANMFTRPEVVRALSRYELSRLYTDGEGEVYARQQQYQEKEFGTIALPLYAIVDANGRPIRTFSGLTRRQSKFLAFLRAT